jgi:xanthine dehydrogenase large subunit
MNQQAEPFLTALDAQTDGAQVHVSRVHESAHLHVSGRATYTDDIPLVAGTLHAALGLSAKRTRSCR